MIKFKTLKLKNFRSYEKLELDNFNKMGLTLISGTNGTGKSTIRQAIEYLLIDTTSENLPMDELPKDSGKDCRLECELEMPNGDEIRITKYRNDTKMGNKIILEINGDDSLTTSDRRVTKKNVEKVLGLTPELLFSSTMFSQDSPSFVESTEKGRKDILYNFIDRNAYDKLLDRAKNKVDELETKLDSLTDERNVDCASIAKVKEQLVAIDRNEKGHKDELWEEIKHLELKREEIFEEDPTPHERHLKNLISQLAESEPDEEKKQELADRLTELTGTRRECEHEIRDCKSKLQSTIGSTCNILKVECPLLAEKTQEIVDMYQPILDVESDNLGSLEIEIEGHKVAIAEIHDAQNANLLLRTKINHTEDDIARLVVYNEQLESMREEVDAQIKQREDNLETNRFIRMRENAKKDIEKLTKTIGVYNEALNETQREKEYFEFWVRGFSRAGIPNMKMEGILASLEGETNNYLSKVSDSIFVAIDAQSELKSSAMKEKISYTVNHPEKTIKAYRSYSGGERQRVKLSDIFAFNSLLGKFDIMILDEVLEGSIDDTGKSMIISLLKEKSKELGSLLVVSHDDYIKDSFDSVLKATKTNGVSSIGR